MEDIFSILEIDKLSVLDFKDALQALGLLQKGNVVDENNSYKHFVDIKKLYFIFYYTLDEERKPRRMHSETNNNHGTTWSNHLATD